MSAAASERLLRPALLLAFDVASIGSRSSPAIEAPRAVRPFVHFAGRLPDAALVAVRRALDDDDAFRSRTAALADEDELGRAGWLFLVRPDGWEQELGSLAALDLDRAGAERENREERTATRRLAHAEEAKRRAEEMAATTQAESAAAQAELLAERRGRRAAAEEVARLTRRVESVEHERDSAQRRAAASAAEAADARAEAEAMRDELVRAEAIAALLEAVESAGSVAAALQRAIEEAAAAVALGASGESASGGPLEAPTGPGVRQTPPRPTGKRQARRRPAALPPAIFDDTTEAAAHLVRLPGVTVLVDGYNAAKMLWPDEAPLELRERLVDALSELVARTGTNVHVVYDGADLGVPQTRPGSRRGVRVSFSPPDVEADDVILELVAVAPPEGPVVVASSDRRVQDGARALGANVISSAQLAAVLGRS